MDWFKVEAKISSNEKVDGLSDRAFRSMIYLWAYAMDHENGGRVPANAHRLVPVVTRRALEELEGSGFIRRNGTGWEIHDWEQHQEEALAFQDRRRREAERLREYRRAQREGSS